MPNTEFSAWFARATGHAPYAYQQRLAEEGWPSVLCVPTGAGKTAAAVLSHVWRRRHHPDLQVRRSTPRRLVLVEPMRVLVDQVQADTRRWLERAGLGAEVDVHVLRGGAGPALDDWRIELDRDQVLVATMDMALSRALNRGYASSRSAWPIAFGLLHNDAAWVFDELQLMGAGLVTARQLEGLRSALGTAAPTCTLYMSATVDVEALPTVDNPTVGPVLTLEDGDRNGPLRVRLDAAKRLHRLDLPVGSGRARALATALVDEHRAGTRSIVVCNTVATAVDVAGQLTKIAPDVPRVLVHSRFRASDRRRLTERALADVDPDGPGLVVVATQALEAGVDISSRLLVTEAAPWPSIVQRAGRCNRAAEHPDAMMLWCPPVSPAPYDDADVAATIAALDRLDGELVTPESLQALDVPQRRPVWSVLRRSDLIALFDTAPDLSGYDVDVATFVRDVEDADVQVAWRDPDSGSGFTDQPPLRAEELCPVPLPGLRAFIRGRQRPVWRYDHMQRRWIRLEGAELRPGITVLLDARSGGYSPDIGWAPQSSQPVVSVATPLSATGADQVDEAVDDEVATVAARAWVSLGEHLADSGSEADALLAVLDPPGLPDAERAAVVLAARLHDVGKASDVFQDAMLRGVSDPERSRLTGGGPWAKSSGRGRLIFDIPHFRHELAGALAVAQHGGGLLEGSAPAQLVVYLVAAHHGKVRLSLRSLPDERHVDARPRAFGVLDGSELPDVVTPEGLLPGGPLSLEPMLLGGSEDGRPSWADQAQHLLDRYGPFRLAYMEALVRMADWRASRLNPEEAS